MLKYGKHALVDGLSGSSGQVALPYAAGAAGPPASADMPAAPEAPRRPGVRTTPTRSTAGASSVATRIGTGRRHDRVATVLPTSEPEAGGG
jgi:hypothetical protein